MYIHWKAPLQTKGFLKIVEMIIALLALSLVAGFVATNTATCKRWNNNTNALASIAARAHYPYSVVEVTITINGNSSSQETVSLSSSFEQASQFFVAWGSLTLFYGVIALVVYMLTTANSSIEWFVNYLIISDLIMHVAWSLCWFIASLEWAVAQNEMKSYIKNKVVHDQILANNCTQNNLENYSGSYAQAAIGDVFGFTSIVLWGINIYWIVIDTSFYLQWKARRRGNLDDM